MLKPRNPVWHIVADSSFHADDETVLKVAERSLFMSDNVRRLGFYKTPHVRKCPIKSEIARQITSTISRSHIDRWTQRRVKSVITESRASGDVFAAVVKLSNVTVARAHYTNDKRVPKSP